MGLGLEIREGRGGEAPMSVRDPAVTPMTRNETRAPGASTARSRASCSRMDFGKRECEWNMQTRGVGGGGECESFMG